MVTLVVTLVVTVVVTVHAVNCHLSGHTHKLVVTLMELVVTSQAGLQLASSSQARGDHSQTTGTAQGPGGLWPVRLCLP